MPAWGRLSQVCTPVPPFDCHPDSQFDKLSFCCRAPGSASATSLPTSPRMTNLEVLCALCNCNSPSLVVLQGARKCIGYQFATQEGVLTLIRLYQKVRQAAGRPGRCACCARCGVQCCTALCGAALCTLVLIIDRSPASLPELGSLGLRAVPGAGRQGSPCM